MAGKVKRISMHLLFLIFSNTIFGLVLYFLTTWLAGYSLVYAYLGNLAFIVLGLALDAFALKALDPKSIATDLETERNKEASLRLVWLYLDSFISFKTALYLFYIIILVVSQLAVFNPGLVGEDMGNFLHVNQFNLVVLIAFDRFTVHFAKDREDMARASEELKGYLSEDQA